MKGTNGISLIKEQIEEIELELCNPEISSYQEMILQERLKDLLTLKKEN